MTAGREWGVAGTENNSPQTTLSLTIFPSPLFVLLSSPFPELLYNSVQLVMTYRSFLRSFWIKVKLKVSLETNYYSSVLPLTFCLSMALSKISPLFVYLSFLQLGVVIITNFSVMAEPSILVFYPDNAVERKLELIYRQAGRQAGRHTGT